MRKINLIVLLVITTLTFSGCYTQTIVYEKEYTPVSTYQYYDTRPTYYDDRTDYHYEKKRHKKRQVCKDNVYCDEKTPSKTTSRFYQITE